MSQSTLDYVFLSDHWEVHNAIVIPKTTAEHAVTSTVVDDINGESKDVKELESYENILNDDMISTQEVADNFISNTSSINHTNNADSYNSNDLLVVNTSQPSESWPSDHFMILVDISCTN